MLRLGRGSLAAAAASLAAVAAAAPAHAATLRGTVVAPPAVHGHQAVVPVLARDGRTLKVVVARTAIRVRTGRIAASGLRFGDRVTVSGARLTGARPRARAVRVTRRGTAPSFAAISRRRGATIKQVQGAITDVGKLPQTTSQITGTPDQLPAEVRARLREVRTTVNYSIADLRDQATALDAVVAAATPVARNGEGYLGALRDAVTAARKAADDLDTAVAGLDTAINDVGGESSPALLPVGVGTVSDLLHEVLDLLRGLPGANPTG